MLSMPFGRPHALLADEQGTGKTPQTIEAAKRAGCRNGLILCPAIIKEQWKRQMVAWGLCAADEIQIIYGMDYPIDNRPWVICNYDLIRNRKVEQPDGTVRIEHSRNHQQLRDRKFHVLVMDEAHRLKTHTSAQTKAVLGYQNGLAANCYYKWALSGSIVPNRPIELYPLLKALAPEVIAPYDNYNAFIDRFCGGSYMEGRGASHVDEFANRLQPFMLLRKLADVWAELPDTIENVVWLDVPYQKHPDWLGEGFMFEPTMRRVVAEAKAPYVASFLKMRLDSQDGHKIVCFTYHRSVIEGIANALSSYHPLKIYGGISHKKRDENLATFAANPDARLMLIQIASGGEGLDGLQHITSECVLAEPEWSPGREDQAIARIRRLGQTQPIILTKLYAKNSYEEVIYWSNQSKREVIDVILKPNGGTFIMSGILESIDSSLKELVSLAKQQANNQQPQANFAPPQLVTPPNIPLATPATAAIGTVPAVPVAPPPPPALAVAPTVAAAPAPVAPVTPPSPPVTPVVSVPVASAPPLVPTASDIDPNKEKFVKEVCTILSTLGKEAGPKKMDELLAIFPNTDTVNRKLRGVEAANWENFLGHCKHAVTSAGLALPA